MIDVVVVALVKVVAITVNAVVAMTDVAIAVTKDLVDAMATVTKDQDVALEANLMRAVRLLALKRQLVLSQLKATKQLRSQLKNQRLQRKRVQAKPKALVLLI